VVIVYPKSPVTKVDRKFLAEIFFRRTTRWSDDSPIKPVDLGPDSPARGRFSQDVLARSVSSVRSYWQQRIFSGQGLPPPELPDDSAVVGYVASHPGAIGYVAAGTSLNGARAVEVD
jgi:ABC-type phosphate transport system substrate-binding protein